MNGILLIKFLVFFFFKPEDPKQKAWFAKSDIKDLFTFQDDDKESERNLLVSMGKQFSSSAMATSAAGLPSAGVVNLVDRADDDLGDQEDARHQHMDMDVIDDDRIMGEGTDDRETFHFDAA